MLSKNQRKQILQLKQKKYRQTKGYFVAEGEKVVDELLSAAWNCINLYVTKPHINSKAQLIDLSTMKQITHFKSPSPFLGVFEIPKSIFKYSENITIALDGISDPGNLGTIIRLCDWFGLKELICSNDTVDCFNPKVIQASMGSIVRVKCHYKSDLAQFLESLGKPIYGADLKGDSIYSSDFSSKASFVFGSESHGLSNEVRKSIKNFIYIPNLRKDRGAESLNVASSTAIFLSEIFKKQ